ncbi:KPN_02809 family neutral zinc metallopeptidase [Flavobacterium eburneipallidum]|uniref:KPN_02809 family neutral zinc metallopeptidase n=1 Tax=Flavobacterium eburneipallidum TaxID=3003263 RepID=UPI0022AC4774|nr:neutral zinc metallopeptidase [Flavobacterium eburneipallidum]
MKWIGRRQSDNVDDRRGMSGGGKTIVGGGIIGIVILLLNAFGGENGQMIGNILQQTQGQQTAQTESRALTPEEEKEGEFVKTLLADNEDVWAKIFAENNLEFEAPRLQLFSGQTQTECGGASSASGPFYCPADKTIYMDMSFFEELRTKFGAEGGDFAIAYVLAHEFGHHIQTILGTSAKMRQDQEGKSEAEANKLSVALELQADFYAGLWTHYNEKQHAMLEPGDIEEALSAANAVGDDAIQKKMQGQVVPDSFTHGTSEQRMYWFNRGFESGNIKMGNTFAEIN